MHVKDVDVRCTKLLERGVNTDVHGLSAVADEVDLLNDGIVTTFEVGRELIDECQICTQVRTGECYLCRDYELIANASLFRPLADELLRALVLTMMDMRARNDRDGWD